MSLDLLEPVPSGHRFKVMIADDSAVVRGMMGRWIDEDPDFDLVGVAVNGLQAIKIAAKTQPDLMVLDVEMPELGGIDALPELMLACPGVKIVMASTSTSERGSLALQALDLGAADIIAKPASSRAGGADTFRADLLNKLRRLGEANVRPRRAPSPKPDMAPGIRPSIKHSARPWAGRSAKTFAAPSPLRILAIAASTGGPPALKQFMKGLGPHWPTPILITQHMPANFTGILAEQLSKACGLKVREGVDGAPLVSGEALLAPGDWHMTVVMKDGAPVIQLDQGPEVNFCRPAADPMLISIAKIFGAGALVVVLTGMGKDGLAGARAVAEAGGQIFAQDEASSIVWGMPGAIVDAGLANEVGATEVLANLALKCVRSK